MRQIVLDTETTGINPKQGNRIIEIGCVELFNRKLTGNNFHCYINPERDSEEGALAVHGLTTEFLRDKPRFHEIVEDLREYVRDAEVIIHNAPFDLGFLNHEFGMLKLPSFDSHIGGVIDTLVQAKEMRPGKRNSLDALCEHFGISNAHRKLHGALLDAELLADVYLAMTRGQNSLGMDIVIEESGSGITVAEIALAEVLVMRASDDEAAAHTEFLDGL
ncbi:MAG: dnaQ [Pseudoduganella sp.]|nr:dnaQ [Pseudoduganella sp.]